MKKNICITLALLCGLTACQQKMEPVLTEEKPAAEGFRYTFPLDESLPEGSLKAVNGTRAFAFESGDAIGYFAGTGRNSSADVILGDDHSPSRFTIVSGTALTPGSWIYCYYPWSSAAGTNPAALTLKIPACQVQTGNSFDADAMPQAGLPVLVTRTFASGSTLDAISFCNLGAILRFDIYTSADDEAGTKVYSVSLDADQSGLTGGFTFDLTGLRLNDEDALAISGLTGRHAETQVSSLTVANGVENAVSVYMVVAPGTFSGSVQVMTNRGIYTFTLPSRTFVRNTVKPFTLDLHSAGSTRIWTVETLAGSGTAGSADGVGTAATYNSPQGVLVGPDGLLWTTQRNGLHGIRTINLSSKQVTTIAHSNTYKFIKHPWHGCFNGAGEYWFCNKSGNSVSKVVYSGGSYTASEVSLTGDVSPATYANPMGVQFDDEGKFYVLCRVSNPSHLLKYNGTALEADYSIPGMIATLAVSTDKAWLIAGGENTSSAYLYRIDKDGTYTVLAGTGSAHTAVGNYTDGNAGNPKSARLGLMEGICMDERGWIWWSESNAGYSEVRVLIPGEGGDYTKGTVHTMAGIPYTVGKARGTADASTFTRSNGICYHEGSWYIAEGSGGERIARLFLAE